MELFSPMKYLQYFKMISIHQKKKFVFLEWIFILLDEAPLDWNIKQELPRKH